MTIRSIRRILAVIVLAAGASLAARAQAQCCGQGATAYYPSTYTAYSPVSYSSYYGGYGYTSGYRGGWYPGYWLNRVRTRLFGSPTTYVASYPATYQAAYQTSYAPSYSVGYSTSYAVPASSGCSTCSSRSVGYAPCSSCSACTTCSPCASCATPSTVSQAVYQQPSGGCASCGNGTSYGPVQSSGSSVQGSQGPTPEPQSTYGAQNGGQSGAPSLDPGASVPTQRPQDTQRPATDDTQQDIQPIPGSDTNDEDPYEVEGDSSTYFQAPKLFDPNDRTAQRSVAPVIQAVYQKPVSHRSVSWKPISREQAERDAAGWVSASSSRE